MSDFDNIYDISGSAYQADEDVKESFRKIFRNTYSNWTDQWESFRAPAILSRTVGLVAATGVVCIELVKPLFYREADHQKQTPTEEPNIRSNADVWRDIEW